MSSLKAPTFSAAMAAIMFATGSRGGWLAISHVLYLLNIYGIRISIVLFEIQLILTWSVSRQKRYPISGMQTSGLQHIQIAS
jgi:hypothetical protein